MNKGTKGKRGFDEKPDKERIHKAIVIADPEQRWWKLTRKIIEKNQNVLYPDELTVSAFLKLCIRYGDACVDAINRERFAANKRAMTREENKRKAMEALRDLGENLNNENK